MAQPASTTAAEVTPPAGMPQEEAPREAAPPTTVVLFYKYAPLADTAAVVAWQQDLTGALSLTGRVLIAEEGINGTLAGTPEAIERYCTAVRSSPFFRDAHAQDPIDFKTSTTTERVLFPDMHVKTVAAICGGGDIAALPKGPNGQPSGGDHLSPQEFHNAMQQEDVVLIDCRNDYEYAIGRFEGATNPGTKHFHEFADYVRLNKDRWMEKKAPVLMYCTGGIRCETASAFMLSEGLEDVKQLKGGIHRYLEAFPQDGGRWRGKNFVFDARVALGPPEQAADQAEVIGQCSIGCGAACERLTGNRVCTVCKDLVLVCDACDEKPENRDLFCRHHESLRGLVFTSLERFATADLTRQLEGLRDKLAAALALAKETGKTRNANYRRHLRRQAARVEEQLVRRRAAGESAPMEDDSPTDRRLPGDSRRQANLCKVAPDERQCRACGLSQSQHDGPLGACWGLWKAHALQEEERTLSPEKREARAAARLQEERVQQRRREEERVARREHSALIHAEYEAARMRKTEQKASKAARVAAKKAARASRLEARRVGEQLGVVLDMQEGAQREQ